MTTPRISLCIISRKEDEDSLKKALDSCAGHVIEINVIDTSKEGSIRLIDSNDLRYSNKDGWTIYKSTTTGLIANCRIIPFKWTNDFAAARNFSFEQATGDVIFWIDSDDTVLHPENLRKLAQLIADGRADWIYSAYEYAHDEQGNVTAVHWKPRLFRKGTVKWEKTVHEDAVPTTGVIQVKDIDTEVASIIVRHNPVSEDQTAHIERNIGIMMEEYVRDGENTDPRTLQYLGFALEGLEKYAEAIPFYHLHVAKSGSNSDRFWSLIHLSRCLYESGDTKNALSVCMDSLKLFPEWKTAYLKLAELYYSLGDWQKCIEWTMTASDKSVPDILDVINPLDYHVFPYVRMAESYLHLAQVKEAFETAQILMRNAPKMPLSKEIYDVAKESVEIENYVRAFLTVAKKFRDYDRVKTVQLFDLIPKELDDDIRIQEARSLFVPPTVWDDKSIVIYCGDSLEDWAYPSIFSGVGGSETAVIRMGEQLAKQGYVVTVYNRCGNLKGEYNGVTYKPYYHFNPKDVFNVLIGWRNPGLFLEKLTAKKKYLWLHDILYPEMINERVIENVDKIIFLSKWHSKNVPGIPDGKIFISNNGITLEDFNDLPEKRPNSLIWSSSPDRGLVPFMENIWPLIKKEIPDVTLDICYGTQNIEKEMASSPYLREVYDKCQEIFKMEGVTNHGRIPHRKLAKLMGSTMVMPYASEFGETNMISSQEAQTAGCYVIMPKDAGGAPEYVKFGKVLDIEKIYTNKEGQKLFAKEVIAALSELPPKKLVDQFSWSVTAYNWTKHLL